MSNRRQFFAAIVLGISSLVGVQSAYASETASDFATRTSAELVELLDQAQTYYEADPDKLHHEMGEFLDKVVDFEGISRGVMGKKYYAQASDEQKANFVTTFRLGLVKAYSQALVGFGHMEIDVLSAKGPSDKKQTVDMVAKSTKDGTKVSVRYSMAAEAPGDWIVRNMIIEGINLGQTYRSQFASSMSRNKGDMDAVINSWSEIDEQK